MKKHSVQILLLLVVAALLLALPLAHGANQTSGQDSLSWPWLTQDIGDVGLPGAAGYSNGTYSVQGSGYHIWETDDSFRYTYQRLQGDGQMVARVASVQDTYEWAKAGVMVRETLNTNSSYALMVITADNGAAFQRRLTTGGDSIQTVGPLVAAPYWVKLVRSGNNFSGYASQDGVTWELVGTEAIAMAPSVYVGLAVSSENNSELCAATLDGVKISGILTGAPTIITEPRTSGPTPPSDVWALCTPSPDTGDLSATCPVIEYQGYTTWVYSFIDNRVSFNLVTYDNQNNVVRNVTVDGARYVYKITSDPVSRSVTIWGQDNQQITIPWSDLAPM